MSTPEADLNKPAIVIRSPKNHLDYEFTDKVEPFAEVLTKPNPAYFNRSSQRSVPQFICIEIIYDHLDSIATRFARSVNDLIDLDYLKSFIGKTAPGNWSGKPVRKTTAQTITPGKTKIENNVIQAVNKTTGNNNGKAISNVSGQTKTAGKAYTVSGTLSAPTGTLATINCKTITPRKSVLEEWSKKDGRDEWGKLLKTQNVALEKQTYQIEKLYIAEINEWQLILKAPVETKRDGPFNNSERNA